MTVGTVGQTTRDFSSTMCESGRLALNFAADSLQILEIGRRFLSLGSHADFQMWIWNLDP